MLIAYVAASCDTAYKQEVSSLGVEGIRAAISETDLGKGRVTGWGLMHLYLLGGGDQTVRMDGVCLRLDSALTAPSEIGKFSLLRPDSEPRSGGFANEYEDYLSQYDACLAMGCDARGEQGSGTMWAGIADRFVRRMRQGSSEETSWTIICGALVFQHLAEGEEKNLCRDSVKSAVHLAVRHRGSMACGGCHYADALCIALAVQLVDDCDVPAVKERIRSIRARIESNYTDDGYVTLPGLDDGRRMHTLKDRIHVLGHIVEFISLITPPYTDHERTLVARFQSDVGQALATAQLEGATIGDAAYGVSGLLRLAQHGYNSK